MRARTKRLRNGLFSVTMAGAILFGGSQAVAAPRSFCDWPNAPAPGCDLGEDCGYLCMGDVGECGGNGCCYCQW